MRIRSSPFAQGGAQGGNAGGGWQSEPQTSPFPNNMGGPAGNMGGPSATPMSSPFPNSGGGNFGQQQSGQDFFDNFDQFSNQNNNASMGSSQNAGGNFGMPVQQPAPQMPPQPNINPNPQNQGVNPNSWLTDAVTGAVAASGASGTNQALAGAVANQFANQGMAQLQASGFGAWFPTAIAALRCRFNVGHSYVVKKLVLLLFPFTLLKKQDQSQAWGASPGSQNSGPQLTPEGLKTELEDADLYIPIMSYVTYVLLFGITRGIHKDFQPELLSGTASKALVISILELLAAKFGFFIAQSKVPVMEIAANCGYKFVCLCIVVTIGIITGGGYLYYGCLVYFAGCIGFVVWHFLSFADTHCTSQQQYGVTSGALTKHIILAIAIAQIPLCWLLTPSLSTKLDPIALAAQMGATQAVTEPPMPAS